MKNNFKVFLDSFFQEPYHTLKLYPIRMTTYEEAPTPKTECGDVHKQKMRDGVPVLETIRS